MNPKNYLGEGLSFVPVMRESASRQTSVVEEFEPGTETDLAQGANPPMDGETEAVQSLTDTKPASDVQPFILFGSSFPKDKEYTQV